MTDYTQKQVGKAKFAAIFNIITVDFFRFGLGLMFSKFIFQII